MSGGKVEALTEEGRGEPKRGGEGRREQQGKTSPALLRLRALISPCGMALIEAPPYLQHLPRRRRRCRRDGSVVGYRRRLLC